MALLLSTSLVSFGAAPKLDLLFATLPTAGGEPMAPIDHGDSIDHEKPQAPSKSNRPTKPGKKPTRVVKENENALTGAPCDQTGICPNSHVGDDFCDPACMTSACTNDMGTLKDVSDCDGPGGLSSKCSTACERGWRGDNYCDPECDNEDCNYDTPSGLDRVLGDCHPGLCAPGCQNGWGGDLTCDEACNNAACNFDYADGRGDCMKNADGEELVGVEAYCAAGCQNSWPGDNWCDKECDNEVCNYDTPRTADGSKGNAATNSDCTHTLDADGEIVPAVVLDANAASIIINARCDPAKECEADWQLDEWCDDECNNEECNFDNGKCEDCNPADGEENVCLPLQISDQVLNAVCDQACNVPECGNDVPPCANSYGYD